MEDEYNTRPRVSFTKTAAVACALVIGLIGTIGGYVANEIFSEPLVVMPPPEVIKEELTEDELRVLAADLIASEQERALTAQSRVQTLEEELAAKERELASLKKGSAGKAEQRSQLKEEMAFLQVQLASAEEERNELRKELRKTLRELDFQIDQTKKFKQKAKHYKMESTANLWTAFSADAKVKICDRGTRRRHAKCHAAVDEAMSSTIRGRFTVCVDTYQSVPVLKKAEKNATMPRYSTKLSDDNKFTKKGWYILFCDPTLPEAGDPDLEGDSVPTYKDVHGEHPEDLEPPPEETAGSDDDYAPAETTKPSSSDDELDLGELDLDFEF